MKIHGRDVPVQVGQVFEVGDERLTVTAPAKSDGDGDIMWHLDGSQSSNNIELCVSLCGWKFVGGPGFEDFCVPAAEHSCRASRPLVGLPAGSPESPTKGSHVRGVLGCVWHGDRSGKPCFCSKNHEAETPAPVRASKPAAPAKPVPFDIVAACDQARGTYVNLTEGHGVSLPGREPWGVRFSF